jgi:PAS domain S-box-containing protein
MTISCNPTPAGRRPHGGPALRRDQAAPALFSLLAESALYRAAYAACGVAMGIVDARLERPQFISVNREFERLLGFHGSDACRYPVVALLLDGNNALAATVFRSEPTREEVEVRRRDGSRLTVALACTPLHDAAGSHTHWAVALSSARAG